MTGQLSLFDLIDEDPEIEAPAETPQLHSIVYFVTGFSVVRALVISLTAPKMPGYITVSAQGNQTYYIPSKKAHRSRIEATEELQEYYQGDIKG